ncbi:hypothetical protein GN244_ATG02182 [Phytophthora infestans]|uniref:Uncharacterized protein n=1 Tax=Phytophthora infestans TaxID=4787 RepID=A0A833W7D9_PHYIN|nr:hypothetical protein GN244_ATG02182 [Phytophthora infestans]KAF4139307.1 hypothetical protein GN958_ATG11523 [Phytophthora infestans]
MSGAHGQAVLTRRRSLALKWLTLAHIDHCSRAGVRIWHQEWSAGSGADFSLKSGTRTTPELT